MSSNKCRSKSLTTCNSPRCPENKHSEKNVKGRSEDEPDLVSFAKSINFHLSSQLLNTLQKTGSSVSANFLSLNIPRPMVTKKEANAFAIEAAQLVKHINSSDNAEDSERMKEALIDYTSLDYSALRDYLYGYHFDESEEFEDGDPRGDAGRPLDFSPSRKTELADAIATLDKALSLAKNPKVPRTVYRGATVPLSVEDDNVDQWLDENYAEGSVWSSKSYLSTTVSAHRTFGFSNLPYSQNKSRYIVFEIFTKQGAALGEETAYYDAEELEVLMPREAKFEVVSCKKHVEYKVEGEDEPFVTERTVIQLIDVNNS